MSKKGSRGSCSEKQQEVLITKQKDLTWTRFKHGIEVVQEIPELCNFSIANLAECDSKEKIWEMIECWVHKGVKSDKSEKSCKDWINNHKWDECLQWGMMYFMDQIRSHLLNCGVNEKNIPLILRKVVLKFNEKYSIAHQSPPVPLFPIQKMFAFSPTKGVPSKSAVGKLKGNPSNTWENLQCLFDYLVSDVSDDKKNSLLDKFKVSENVTKKSKNRQKLDAIATAYEFGFKYPKFILTNIDNAVENGDDNGDNDSTMNNDGTSDVKDEMGAAMSDTTASLSGTTFKTENEFSSSEDDSLPPSLQQQCGQFNDWNGCLTSNNNGSNIANGFLSDFDISCDMLNNSSFSMHNSMGDNLDGVNGDRQIGQMAQAMHAQAAQLQEDKKVRDAFMKNEFQKQQMLKQQMLQYQIAPPQQHRQQSHLNLQQTWYQSNNNNNNNANNNKYNYNGYNNYNNYNCYSNSNYNNNNNNGNVQVYGNHEVNHNLNGFCNNDMNDINSIGNFNQLGGTFSSGSNVNNMNIISGNGNIDIDCQDFGMTQSYMNEQCHFDTSLDTEMIQTQNVPNCSNLPPNLPRLPNLPNLSSFPTVPSLPNLPNLPNVSNKNLNIPRLVTPNQNNCFVPLAASSMQLDD